MVNEMSVNNGIGARSKTRNLLINGLVTERSFAGNRQFSNLYVQLFKPEQRFENRSNVMKFRRICNSTSSRIENKLQTIKLVSRKIQEY
jgi:hypothetical protein